MAATVEMVHRDSGEKRWFYTVDAKEYMAKGRQIYVEGKLQTRSWEDRDGNKRYTTEIKADQIIMLGTRGDSAGGPDTPAPPPEPDAAPFEAKDDDVPF